MPRMAAASSPGPHPPIGASDPVRRPEAGSLAWVDAHAPSRCGRASISSVPLVGGRRCAVRPLWGSRAAHAAVLVGGSVGRRSARGRGRWSVGRWSAGRRTGGAGRRVGGGRRWSAVLVGGSAGRPGGALAALVGTRRCWSAGGRGRRGGGGRPGGALGSAGRWCTGRRARRRSTGRRARRRSMAQTAASTIARASSRIRSRCASPRKLSA